MWLAGQLAQRTGPLTVGAVPPLMGDLGSGKRRVPPSSRGAKRGYLVGGLEEGDSLDVRVNDIVAGFWSWLPDAGVKVQVYCVEAVPGDCTDIPRLVLRSVPCGWLGSSPNARAL